MSETAFYREVGRRIEARRKVLRKKQSELADEIGVNQSRISQIENGTYGMPLYTFFIIAAALNASPISLLFAEPGEKQ